jgi:hypothetical protein
MAGIKVSTGLTEKEMAEFAMRMALSRSAEGFVAVFAEYAKAVMDRESDPYIKIGTFVVGIIQGCREAAEDPEAAMARVRATAAFLRKSDNDQTS